MRSSVVISVPLICAPLVGCMSRALDLEPEYQQPLFNLGLSACIGERDSAYGTFNCRTQLQQLSRLFEGRTAGCFFVQQEGHSAQYSSFQWRDDGSVYFKSSKFSLTPGELFNTHLYFLKGDITERLDCEPYAETLKLNCREIDSCMVKLTSLPERFETKEVKVSYLNGLGLCGITSEPSFFSAELDDLVDNDCDSRVDEGLR